MTRVHEEYSKTGDNDHSIRVGIKESGPVIVAAALLCSVYSSHSSSKMTVQLSQWVSH